MVLFLLAFSLAEGKYFKARKATSSPMAWCVSQWKMNDNETNTTVVDSQGYSDGISVQDTCDVNAVGKVGGALDFDGINDDVDTNNTFQSVFQGQDNNSFSLCCWVEPDDGQPSTTETFCGSKEVNPKIPRVAIHLDVGGKIVGDYFTDEGIEEGLDFFSPNPVFTDGQQDWHFIVMNVEQVNPTQVKLSLYFDNALLGSNTEDCVMTEFATSTNFALGNEGGQNQHFAGLIDNVMIFNKAISQAEINWLWNGGAGRE